MSQIEMNHILLLDESNEIVTIHMSDRQLIWHIQGKVKGQWKLSDIVFCQYRHKTDELFIIALPRKKERGKIELRERVYQQVHFYNNPSVIYNNAIHSNNAYRLYKRLHAILIQEYKSNTNELQTVNKRYYNNEEMNESLQLHLSVNSSQSYLEIYKYRRVFVILNPHGGNTQAPKIWEDIVKPLLFAVNIQYTFQTTNYPGHAEDLGVQFDSSKYDSVLFISGDGTVNEFLNGVLSREDARHILFFTTIGMISAGTQNSLARGMGTHSIYTALYCLLKRKVRVFDGICVENGAHLCRYSFAGCGWGIVSDMVKDYERYRWLKQYRYWLLKGIHGCFCRRNHYCSIRYIEDDNQIRLRCNHKQPSCDECIEHSTHISNLPTLPQSDLGISLSLSECSSDVESIPTPPSNKTSPINVHAVQSSNVERLINEMDLGKTRRFEDEGYFHTIGVINSSPDSKWCHISFYGVMDIVIAKKGNCLDDMAIALRYVVGTEYDSDMMLYKKVKQLEISSLTDDVVMLDGEVFPGPSPFRFICIPSLLTVFGEYYNVA